MHIFKVFTIFFDFLALLVYDCICPTRSLRVLWFDEIYFPSKNEKALRRAPFQNPELWVLMGASPDEHSTGFELGLI